MTDAMLEQVALSTAHRGAWSGTNRLWITDPTTPFDSDGTLEIAERTISYTWSHDGTPHAGTIVIKGQPGALAASWTDSFHAVEPFTLHGRLDGDVLRLYTTYDAGEATWGWIIELDTGADDACTLGMFNVMPGLGVVPAVLLDGRR